MKGKIARRRKGMSHSRYWYSIIMLILLAAYSSAYTQAEFTNGLSAENLTFSGDSNVTRYVEIPRYVNVTDASTMIRGAINYGYIMLNQPYNYSCTELSVNCSSAIDGSYNTSYSVNETYNLSDMIINYSIIPGSNILLQEKVAYPGGPLTYNTSLPSNCLDRDTLSIKYRLQYISTWKRWHYCYNGTDYEQFYYYAQTGTKVAIIYDARLFINTTYHKMSHNTNTTEGGIGLSGSAYDGNYSTYTTFPVADPVDPTVYNITLNYTGLVPSYVHLVAGSTTEIIYHNYSSIHPDCDYPLSLKAQTAMDVLDFVGWVTIQCKNGTSLIPLIQSTTASDAAHIYEVEVFGYNYPENANLSINDEYVWNHTGIFNSTAQANFTSALNDILPGCTCTGCTISENTCIIPFVFYSNTTGIIEVSNINISYNYSINVLIRDELTDTLITDNNVHVDFINDYESINYTTQSSNDTVNLLLGEYIVRYSGDDYAEKFYYMYVDDNTNNTLILYLLNQTHTDNVTATIYDEIGRVVENAYVRYLRYDISTNTYTTVGTGRTDVQGETILKVTKNTEFYKFMIYYPITTLRFTSTGTYITKDSIEFQINIGETIGADVATLWDITADIDWQNSTDDFRFTASDNNGDSRQFCLEVSKVGTMGTTLVNSSCSTSSAVVITLGVDNVNGTTYEAKGYAYISDEKRYLTGAMHTYPSRGTIMGDMGLYFVLVVSIVFICMFPFAPWLAAIGMAVPIWLSNYMGLISLPMVVQISLFISGIIVAYLVDTKARI